MRNFHRSIILVIIVFVAVVGFNTQAMAGVDAVTAATKCRTAEKDCEPGELCIRDNEDDRSGLCLECVIDADCAEGAICENDVCVAYCLDNADCAEGEICEDDVCVVDCPEIADIDFDGNCLLNKEELKLYKDVLKAKHKLEKDTLKISQSEDKETYKRLKDEYAE